MTSTDFAKPDKQQVQKSMAFIVTSLQQQARYELSTLKRTIAIVHRVLRESDNDQNQKRLGDLIGELTSLAHLIETEAEENITHSFEASDVESESHSSIQ